MDNNAQKVTVNLIPGGTALTIVFVLLKAFDKIDWSWWWVFAPMWGPFAIILGLFALLAVGYGVVMIVLGLLTVIETVYRKWKKR